MTGAFSQYLAFTTPFLKVLPSDEVGVWDGVWWLWDNGWSIDFWSRGAHPKCCETKECGDSAMLCGNCVRDTVPNNILYGFVAAAHGVAIADATSGANVTNILSGGGLEGCEQFHAYEIGYRLWDSFSTYGARLSEANMCSIINSASSDPFGWYPLINCVKRPFEGCGNCGKKLSLAQIPKIGIGNTILPPLPTE